MTTIKLLQDIIKEKEYQMEEELKPYGATWAGPYSRMETSAGVICGEHINIIFPSRVPVRCLHQIVNIVNRIYGKPLKIIRIEKTFVFVYSED